MVANLPVQVFKNVDFVVVGGQSKRQRDVMTFEHGAADMQTVILLTVATDALASLKPWYCVNFHTQTLRSQRQTDNPVYLMIPELQISIPFTSLSLHLPLPSQMQRNLHKFLNDYCLLDVRNCIIKALRGKCSKQQKPTGSSGVTLVDPAEKSSLSPAAPNKVLVQTLRVSFVQLCKSYYWRQCCNQSIIQSINLSIKIFIVA